MPDYHMIERLAEAQTQLDALRRPQDPAELDALAAAHSRADAVANMLGERALPPVPGESSLAYRKRLAAKLQRYSSRFATSRLDALDAATFGPIEDIVYADAAAAAMRPDSAPLGQLRAITTHEGGRDVTRFAGDIGSWMQHFQSGAQVCQLNTKPGAR